MSIRHLGHDQWQSTLDGGIYTSKEAAEHYERQALAKAHSETPGSKILNSLSAPELKSLFEAATVEADQAESTRSWQSVQEQFLADCPAFLPCVENGSALATLLIERNKLTSQGTFLGVQEDVTQAFLDLCDRGMMRLVKGEPLPQRTSELELYNMSADELLKASRGF